VQWVEDLRQVLIFPVHGWRAGQTLVGEDGSGGNVSRPLLWEAAVRAVNADPSLLEAMEAADRLGGERGVYDWARQFSLEARTDG
jgi:hypothetical protein